jgi:hypothetical protein
MSTTSTIIAKFGDKYRGISCHFDGYPEGVGKTLLNFYSNPDKVAALINLGDISCLKKEVAPQGAHSNGNPEKDVTIAYMRDCGEEDCEALEDDTANGVANSIEPSGYVYIFDGKEWTCNGIPLAEAVEQAELAQRSRDL